MNAFVRTLVRLGIVVTGLTQLALGQSVTMRQLHGWLTVTAVTDNVVRVTRSNSKSIPGDLLPVVVQHPSKVKTRKFYSNGGGELDTPLLKVRISPGGAVSFRDKTGAVVSSEVSRSAQLTPFKLPKFPGEEAYHSNLAFTLKPGEAIFGLGQHQDGQLDRRGSTTVLSQENREVAIPWMLSSRGYGVLWNNASRTLVDAGGVGDRKSLVDDGGRAGALTGHYFRGKGFESPVGSRRDSNIDFNWTQGAPMGLGLENYSVRWTGTFVAETGGNYLFRVTADDGERLYIDDKPIVDDWSVHAERLGTGSVFLTAHSRHKIRLEFFQATRDSIIRLSWSAPGWASIDWSSYAAKSIDYYFVYGPKIDDVLASYRKLTGDAPMPPKWALGYWQSKERYATQQEWIEIAEGYRSRHLPIDNLVQDWFYWDPHAWGSHQFDAKRYPSPAAGIDTLHRDYQLHFMISVWGKFAPGTAADPDPNYQELNRAGQLYPDGVSSPERYYDAFSAGARATYWKQIQKDLFDKGVDAWWLDASEPEANLTQLDETKTGAGPGAFVVSGWPLMHTSGVYQGQRAANPDKRVFILTRSAFAGQQRNGAATWSGDITANWDTLARQIPAGINLCLSGIPYWTTDIGAFFVPYPGGSQNPEYRELYTRWFEFGAFCPIFRSHGTDTPREMWRFGPDTEKILLKYDRLRYSLMPYLYSSAWKVTTKGESIMRGLVEDFPSDKIASEVSNEFLFGPSMLTCPVTTRGAQRRQVYLPAGVDWYDFWSNRRLKGGRWISAAAPLDCEPIYVRAGSIIPIQSDVEYTAQTPAKIEARIYPGANASFELHEDSGDGYGYEHGAYATTLLTWNERTRRLHVGRRTGRYPGMGAAIPIQSTTIGSR